MKILHKNAQLLLALFFFFFLGRSAYSHPGHIGSGIVSGFLHPFEGLDHFLAALALGIFVSLSSNRFEFRLPLVFISLLFFGAIVGYFYTKIPGAEGGIILSLFVLSFAIMLSQDMSKKIKFGFAALFGFFHGNAHGSEFVGSVFNFFNYIFAILLATAFLHMAGIFLVLAFKKYLSTSKTKTVVQVFGITIFLISLSLLFS